MRRYSVLIIGVVVAAVCVRLGFWQLSRLGQRLAFRAKVEVRMRQPVFELTARSALPVVTFGTPDSLAYNPGVARGVFDFAHQMMLIGRSVDQVPAVYVVTPLHLFDGAAVLVERGWVPSPDAYTANLDSLAERDTAEVRGILLNVTSARVPTTRDTTWPVHIDSDDPSRLAMSFPYPLLPWVLRRTDAPAGGPPALRPIPAPVIDNGPHLSYAIQWFSFALIALVGSFVLYRKSVGGGGERGRGTGEGGPIPTGGL
jgi:surfeit locus 1 family protein